jgi:hypothetical protein
MKNLKKLSLALMLATLFSTSFTSCIDNNVSPLVEAIYAAQADLIAAQAAVQNAEAALRLAQAEAEEARATLLEAQAAEYQAHADATAAESAADQLRWAEELATLIENNDISVAWYQAKLDAAQAQYDVDIAELIEELEEMGALAAIDYAEAYAHHTDEANNIFQNVLQKQAELAIAELMLTDDDPPVSMAYAIAQLEGEVAMYTAAKEALEDAVADMQAAMADPNSIPNILAALNDDWDMYEAAEDANDIAQQEKLNEIMAVYEENDVREDFISRYEDALDEHDDAVDEKEDREGWIATAQADIALWETELADWEGAKAMYALAVTEAADAVTAAWAALDVDMGENFNWDEDYDVDADGDALTPGGDAGLVKYAGTSFKEVFANLTIDYNDALDAYNSAAAALSDYQDEFDDLTLAYNEAATELAFQESLLVGNTAADDLADAILDTDAAQDDLDDAMAAYLAAQTTFELDPDGFVITDVDQGFGDGFVDDLGEVGVPADAQTTYMWVEDWVETSLGSGQYIPSVLSLPTVEADLVALADALIADGTNGINVYGDIVLWQQDGTATDAAGALTALVNGGNNDLFIDGPEVINADPDGAFATAYLLEIEADDTSTNNLYNFNVATNMLGVEDFNDRPFMLDDAPTWNDPLVVGDDMAGYDSTPDANGEPDGAADTLTAYAVLWNMQLAQAIAQYNFDHLEDALMEAQEDYDYWKDIYDNGLTVIADLTDAMNAAEGLKDDALETWTDYNNDVLDPAKVELGQNFPEGMAGDTPRLPGDAVPTDSLTLNEEEYNAEIALAEFCERTEEDIQADIDEAMDNIAEWTLEISQIQPIIDAKLAIVLAMQDEYDEYILNEGELSSLAADLHAQIIALWQEMWELEAEEDALEFQQDLIEDLIEEYEDEYDAEDLEFAYDALIEDWEEACDALEEAKAALATAQVDADAAEAYIAYLQSLIDTLLAQHANELAIAEEYKALMEAALAS